MYHRVAVVKVNGKNLDAYVHQSIDLVGGFRPYKNSRIVIKPNLCSVRKSPEDGVTTDVRVVEAVVNYIRKRNKRCEIMIAESNGEFGGTADEAFKRFGYDELADRYNIQLCNLSKETTVKVEIPHAKKMKRIEIPMALFLMDHYISIAKLKRHSIERFTGVWKNQYGCISNRKLRSNLHPFLSEVLFDLNQILCPDLSIIDAITALEGSGPIEGTPKRMNLIICSKNPLSADIVAAKIIGEKPQSVPHIKYALAQGLGDAENLTLLGETTIRTNLQFISTIEYLRTRSWLYYLKLRSRLGLKSFVPPRRISRDKPS